MTKLFARLSLAVAVSTFAAAVVGCASAQPTAQGSSGRRTVGLSLKEAQQIVAGFESKQVPPQKAVGVPGDTKAALEILKSDRIDAFPAAVAWLGKQEGYDALALKAQVELAWGEAELTVAEVLSHTASQLEQNLRGWEVRKSLSDADKAKIQAERERIAVYRETDEALRLLAAEHVGQGAEDAEKAIGQKPDDYVGYRIAADAARLRNQWPEFTANVKKVEAQNPDSNGLKFLRGVEAYMRDGDSREAATHFRDALAGDPAFVRAQAQLVLVSPNIFEQHKELMALQGMAPDHQIVRWAGPGIENAHTAAKERQAAIQQAITNRPNAATNTIKNN